MGAKDVGICNRGGARCTSPLSRARGVREVSATGDSDSVAEVDGSLMFPEVLRPAPGEGITARLIVPHVGKVLCTGCAGGQGCRGGAGTPRESDPRST